MKAKYVALNFFMALLTNMDLNHNLIDPWKGL